MHNCVEFLMEKVTTSWSDIPGIIQISDIKLGCVENTRSNIILFLVGK